MGVLVGLIPGISWGFITPVSKKLGGKPECQTLGICITAFLLGIILLIINCSIANVNYFNTTDGIVCFFITMISGMCWFAGGIFQLIAVKESSVAKTMPISSSAQLISVSLFSAIVFKTWFKKPEMQFPIGLLLIAIICVGVYLTSLDKKQTNEAKETIAIEKKNNLLFWIAISLSTIGFFLYAIIPQTISDVFENPNKDLFDQGNMFPQSLGMVLCASIFCIVKYFVHDKKNNIGFTFCQKATYKNMITGIFQANGNLFFFVAIAMIGTVYASPLSQVGVVVATLLGVFWLKERKVHPYDYIVYIGLVLIVAGAIILGYMDLMIGIPVE